MRRFIVGFLSILICGCASTAIRSGDGQAFVRSASQKYMSAFNAGNADGVAALYADDAIFLAPNSPIASGRTAIRDAVRKFLAAHPVLDYTPDRVAQSGDMTYEYGHYTMQIGPNRDQGNYVAVWRRMANGDWKIVADSVNSSLPAQPAK